MTIKRENIQRAMTLNEHYGEGTYTFDITYTAYGREVVVQCEQVSTELIRYMVPNEEELVTDSYNKMFEAVTDIIESAINA